MTCPVNDGVKLIHCAAGMNVDFGTWDGGADESWRQWDPTWAIWYLTADILPRDRKGDLIALAFSSRRGVPGLL